MITINFKHSFKALSDFVEKYNLEQDKGKTIKAGMIYTAHEIIRIYGAFIIKLNGIQPFSKENLPALKTNNMQLAKLTQSSSRTIQRHIIRLQEAGIITRKIFRGTNGGFELFINPKILLISKELPVNNSNSSKNVAPKPNFQSAEKQFFKNSVVSNCPHTNTIETYINNNIIKGVNKSGNEKNTNSGVSSLRKNEKKEIRSLLSHILDTGNTFAGNTGGESAKCLNEAGGEVQNNRRAGGAGRGDIQAQGHAAARRASLSFYTKMLWSLAKNVLYRDRYLTEKQVEIAHKLIYKWYEPVKDESLAKVHQVYVKRIGMVMKYLNKDPENRFVQLPNRYFNPENPHGFAGTKKWFEQEKKHKRTVKKKVILHDSIKRYLRNESKTDSSRKPSLQVYLECETRVSKLGDPALLSFFHAAVLDPSIIHQIK